MSSWQIMPWCVWCHKQQRCTTGMETQRKTSHHWFCCFLSHQLIIIMRTRSQVRRGGNVYNHINVSLVRSDMQTFKKKVGGGEDLFIITETAVLLDFFLKRLDHDNCNRETPSSIVKRIFILNPHPLTKKWNLCSTANKNKTRNSCVHTQSKKKQKIVFRFVHIFIFWQANWTSVNHRPSCSGPISPPTSSSPFASV